MNIKTIIYGWFILSHLLPEMTAEEIMRRILIDATM